MAFYDIFENLCAEKGVTPTQAARDNGIKQSVVAMWKKRGSTPKAETVQKLASYFDVSVDYLLSGEAAVAQIHLANGVHIYKNSFPYKNSESFLADFPEDGFNILYQDKYLLIIVEKDTNLTHEELNKIVASYTHQDYTKKKQQPNKDNFDNQLKKLSDTARAVLQTKLSFILEDLPFDDLETLVKYAQFIQSQAQQPTQSPPCPQVGAETALQSPPAPAEGTDTTSPSEGTEGAQKGE